MSIALLNLQAATASAAMPYTAQQFLAGQLVFYALACLLCGALAAVVHYKLLLPYLFSRVPAPQRARGLQRVISGAGLAAGLLLAVLAPGLAAGWFSPSMPGFAPYAALFAPGPPPDGWLLWSFFTFQGSFEELLFRGVGTALLALLVAWAARLALGFAPSTPPPAQVRLWFWSGFAANAAVSLAFGLVHANNAHATPFAVANVVLAGLVLGQLYWLQRSLWGACALHVVWNAGQATLGIPVSGYLLRDPLLGNITGAVPGPLTGGQFGIEASLPLTIVWTALWLWLVWRTWRLAQPMPLSRSNTPSSG